MYEITVKYQFTATHAIPLPDGTPETPHEHLWCVSATFRSEELDESMGVVIDFVAVRGVLEAIAQELEGADLDQLEAFRAAPPSAERVARYVAQLLTQRLDGGRLLYRVAVTEAPNCEAAYYPGPRRP